VRHAVRRIDHLPLEMDDGVVLSAAVFLPDAPGRFSAVIDAVPYRKDDDFLSGDWDVYGDLAARGFACVRIDLRGSGSSTGILENEYLAREHDDLVRAIAVRESTWYQYETYPSGRCVLHYSCGDFVPTATADTLDGAAQQACPP